MYTSGNCHSDYTPTPLSGSQGFSEVLSGFHEFSVALMGSLRLSVDLKGGFSEFLNGLCVFNGYM